MMMQNANNGRGIGFPYRIEYDGMVNVPSLGRVKLAGLTLREAEFKVEELFSHYFQHPFVLLSITNNRVIVSPGSGGAAQAGPAESASCVPSSSRVVSKTACVKR